MQTQNQTETVTSRSVDWQFFVFCFQALSTQVSISISLVWSFHERWEKESEHSSLLLLLDCFSFCFCWQLSSNILYFCGTPGILTPALLWASNLYHESSEVLSIIRSISKAIKYRLSHASEELEVGSKNLLQNLHDLLFGSELDAV